MNYVSFRKVYLRQMLFHVASLSSAYWSMEVPYPVTKFHSLRYLPVGFTLISECLICITVMADTLSYVAILIRNPFFIESLTHFKLIIGFKPYCWVHHNTACEPVDDRAARMSSSYFMGQGLTRLPFVYNIIQVISVLQPKITYRWGLLDTRYHPLRTCISVKDRYVETFPYRTIRTYVSV